MKTNWITFSLLAVLSACASHSTMRGGVAMKVSDREAHVCLGEGEVKPGDKVVAFYNDCSSRNVGAKGAATPCEKKQLGYGKIVRNLNEHYSVVEFDPGVEFTEGTFVERKK